MPVVHQMQVVRVVVANLLESVGKFLTTRKQLFEVRKAGGHGVPSRINNGCVGENGLDEPNVNPIVRHLIDEKGLICPIGARAIEITLAECLTLILAHRP